MESFIPLIVAFAMIFFAIPIPVCLLAGTFVYFAFINTGLPLTGVIQNIITQNMAQGLLAPLFYIVGGTLMAHTGIAGRLLNFCDCLLGHKNGGLAYVNVLLSTINGGMSGSCTADAAYECKMLVPEMNKRGYPVAFSAAVTAATGLITPIIPPGTGLIVYAIMADVSVGRIWVSGYLPGIALCLAMMFVCYLYARKESWGKSRENRASAKEVLSAFKDSIFALLIPFFLIFGLRSGLFTAVEGGCVLLMLAVLIGIIYKTLRLDDIIPIVKESFECVANVMLICVSACGFTTYLSWERIPQKLSGVITSMTSNPIVFQLLVLAVLLFLGMFIDSLALLMVVTPMFVPIATMFGIDLIPFGLLLIIGTNIGCITPPFGALMFLCCKLCKTTVPAFTKYAWPFMLAMVVVCLWIIFFPSMITWIPNLVYGA